jgi:hypothetical protein
MWMTGGGIKAGVSYGSTDEIGYKAGVSYGSTDEIGYKAVENPTSVHDIHATILH